MTWAHRLSAGMLGVALAGPAWALSGAAIAVGEAAPDRAQPPITQGAVPPMPQPDSDLLTGVIWLDAPEGSDFARFYPRQALDEHLNGSVVLDCVVGGDGRLNCAVVSEEPVGYGFGEAALAVSREFRAAARTRDGVATAGGRLRRTVRWTLR